MEDRMPIIWSVAALALVCLAGGLQAHAFGAEGTANQDAHASVFRLMDTNDDGTLDKNEVSNDKLFKDGFADADTDEDGLLSMNEYAEHRRRAEQQNVKRIAGDAELVTRVKATLVKDAGLKSMKINVDAYKGTVILSGFVDSVSMAQQAEKIVRGVNGVETIKNSLVVKDQGGRG